MVRGLLFAANGRDTQLSNWGGTSVHRVLSFKRLWREKRAHMGVENGSLAGAEVTEDCGSPVLLAPPSSQTPPQAQ